MRKSLIGVVITPFITIAAMFLAKELKKDTSMSENFVYSMRRMQEKFALSKINYGRSSD